MNRKVIEASTEHKRIFEQTWKLRDDLKGSPYWEDAYEYAANYKLNADEITAIGAVLVRREMVPNPSSNSIGRRASIRQ